MSQMIKFEKAGRSGDVCERVKIVHGVDVVNFNVALNDKDFSSSYSFTGISHFKSFYGHSFKWKIYKLNMKSMCRNLRISQEIKFYLLFFSFLSFSLTLSDMYDPSHSWTYLDIRTHVPSSMLFCQANGWSVWGVYKR